MFNDRLWKESDPCINAVFFCKNHFKDSLFSEPLNTVLMTPVIIQQVYYS
jgi:hypothetical protein